MINCDYFIIGMGIAGIGLKYKLKGDVILVDKNPFSYKIGESFVPNLIDADIGILKLVPKFAKKLESFQIKKGTILADSKNSLYSKQIYTDLKDVFTFHSERAELEKLLVDELNIIYKQEKVIDIDFKTNIVNTNLNTYKVNKYILDCSGPRMFVADKLGLVKNVYEDKQKFATWRYWDLEEYDIKKEKVNEYTLLNQIDNETWLWQIPIFGGKTISIGIVSINKRISEQEYFKLVDKYKHPFYEKIKKYSGLNNDLKRQYFRRNFSKISTKACSDNYILVGDAYAFADPVFSVGAGIAMSEAIYIAKHLNNNTFSSKDYQEKCDKTTSLLLLPFESWYETGWEDIYVLNKIEKGVLQGKIINNELNSYDNMLRRYSEFVSSLEGRYGGNHESVIERNKENILLFFHESTMVEEDGCLKIGFYGLKGSYYKTIDNKNIIDLFIKNKNNIFYLNDLLLLGKKELTKSDYLVFNIYVLKLIKDRILPIYFDNKI